MPSLKRPYNKSRSIFYSPLCLFKIPLASVWKTSRFRRLYTASKESNFGGCDCSKEQPFYDVWLDSYLIYWMVHTCTYLLGSWTLQYDVFLSSFYLIRVSNKFLVVPWLYFQDNLRTPHAFKKPENFCISKLQEIAVRDHSVPTCLYVQYNVLYYLPSLLRSDTVPKQIKECIRKGCTLGTSYRKEFFLLQQSENFLKVPRFNTNIL